MTEQDNEFRKKNFVIYYPIGKVTHENGTQEKTSDVAKRLLNDFLEGKPVKLPSTCHPGTNIRQWEIKEYEISSD